MTQTPPPPPETLSLRDAAEMLWVVLANVSGGDWSKQTPEWQEAAARWRDAYFAALRAAPPQATEGEAERTVRSIVAILGLGHVPPR